MLYNVAMEKKKVLIIGNSAKEYALAKKMKNCDCEVVVLPGNSAIKEIAECVDIREENIQEILEYIYIWVCKERYLNQSVTGNF